MRWNSVAFLLTAGIRVRNGSNAFRLISSQQHRSTIPTTTTRLHFATATTPFIHLRNATLQDLDTILSWEDKPHLQDPDTMGDAEFNDWNWEYELSRTSLSWRYQLIAECNQKPIGMIQIIDPAEEESHYWGTDCPRNLRALDIWIGEEEYLGKGYGTQMMMQALDQYCFADPAVQAAIVDPMAANPKAHRFYQKVGFVPEGIRYFGPDKCLVHRLTRDDYEQKWSCNTRQ